MDVSIIIVNYNTKELLKDCLESIYKNTLNIEFEVFVSDNGSVDGSVQMVKTNFPSVILIENNENLGFGRANNRALSIAQGKYVFYLNSDTILLNNAVKLFFDFWESYEGNGELGALGANLVDKNGNINNSYGSFPNINKDVISSCGAAYRVFKFTFLNLLFRKPIPAPIAGTPFEKKIGEVDYIIGADLFLKNDKNAYFDERYFLYYEENDLEYSLFLQGKKRILIDGPEIIHLDGGSSPKSGVNLVTAFASFASLNSNLSRIIFYKKHGANKFKIFIIKICLVFIYINPLIFKITKKHILKLLKA